MKKLLILSAIFLSSFNNSFSQNHDWITPNKIYLKMYVSDDGIYRIDKNDFTAAGINTNTIDPRTLKVYNKGLQIPILIFTVRVITAALPQLTKQLIQLLIQLTNILINTQTLMFTGLRGEAVMA